MAIMSRARPRGDKRGHRNVGIDTDGRRMPELAPIVLAYAIVTSSDAEIAEHFTDHGAQLSRLGDTLAVYRPEGEAQCSGESSMISQPYGPTGQSGG
jgi:hypothetical protein